MARRTVERLMRELGITGAVRGQKVITTIPDASRHRRVDRIGRRRQRQCLMGSTIGLFKTELIKPRRPWKTLSEVELATAEWIDWYCHRRLHGEIGHTPPVEYGANYYRATTKIEVTVTT